jgi:predicted ester cyclase
MDVETTRSVMDEYLRALIGGQDFGRFFAPDVIWTTMETGETVRGREAVRDLIVAIHTQAFQGRAELVHLVTGRGSAMVEAVFDGTHVGEFAGVAPTGRHVRAPYCMAYDVSADAITALRSYFPVAAISAQLTAADRSTSAPA